MWSGPTHLDRNFHLHSVRLVCRLMHYAAITHLNNIERHQDSRCQQNKDSSQQDIRRMMRGLVLMDAALRATLRMRAHDEL